MFHWVLNTPVSLDQYDECVQGLEATTGAFVQKKCVFKNFSKFTGKHEYQSFFFNKVVGVRLFFIKRKALVQVFSCEFCEIPKNIFSYRTPPVAASA